MHLYSVEHPGFYNIYARERLTHIEHCAVACIYFHSWFPHQRAEWYRWDGICQLLLLPITSSCNSVQVRPRRLYTFNDAKDLCLICISNLSKWFWSVQNRNQHHNTCIVLKLHFCTNHIMFFVYKWYMYDVQWLPLFFSRSITRRFVIKYNEDILFSNYIPLKQTQPTLSIFQFHHVMKWISSFWDFYTD